MDSLSDDIPSGAVVALMLLPTSLTHAVPTRSITQAAVRASSGETAGPSVDTNDRGPPRRYLARQPPLGGQLLSRRTTLPSSMSIVHSDRGKGKRGQTSSDASTHCIFTVTRGVEVVKSGRIRSDNAAVLRPNRERGRSVGGASGRRKMDHDFK